MHCGSVKANRRVDADAAVSGFFDRRNAGAGDRNLHDHVGREPVEFLGLLNDGVRVTVEAGISLNGEPAVLAAVSVENGLQKSRRL